MGWPIAILIAIAIAIGIAIAIHDPKTLQGN
jgi:hypothetical protein